MHYYRTCYIFFIKFQETNYWLLVRFLQVRNIQRTIAPYSATYSHMV